MVIVVMYCFRGFGLFWFVDDGNYLLDLFFLMIKFFKDDENVMKVILKFVCDGINLFFYCFIRWKILLFYL